MEPYARDLAYTHDAGFGDFARDAAPDLLRRLRDAGLDGGLVVDLGCGSGIWAAELLANGFEVLGVDISSAMLEIARERAPAARFVHASLLDAGLEPCAAVTAISEPFNYAFDPRVGRAALAGLFARVHDALRPGGLLLFDVLGPGHVPEPQRHFTPGDDWVVCAEIVEDTAARRLTRDIVTFRRQAGRPLWERSDERHVALLYDPAAVLADLRAAGFANPAALPGWGDLRFAPGHAAFAAQRPPP